MSDTRADQWIRVGRLIDGQGGPLCEDAVIGVRDGGVHSILPAHRDQAVTLDFSHATVLPALMDAHVHLTFSGSGDAGTRAGQLNPSPEQSRAAIGRHLRDHWQCGVAAVRDGGDRRGDLLDCRQQGRLPPDPPVTVACPGWAWHAPGRYGAMIGRTPSDGLTLTEAAMARLDGIDHLKLIQSGLNSLDRFGYQGGPQFSQDDLRAVARAAQAAGKPVMVHANGETAVRMAVEAGCDSIEHGYFMGPDNLRRMADNGVVWVPTALPMAVLARDPGLSAMQQDTAKRTLDHQLEQIRQARGLGVTIALGTDAGGRGVEHGRSVRQELKLFLTAGLGLEEAVRCASLNVAQLMGLAGRGALRPGWRADFIVVPGSPNHLPENLAAIQAICLAGRWFHSALPVSASHCDETC